METRPTLSSRTRRRKRSGRLNFCSRLRRSTAGDLGPLRDHSCTAECERRGSVGGLRRQGYPRTAPGTPYRAGVAPPRNHFSRGIEKLSVPRLSFVQQCRGTQRALRRCASSPSQTCERGHGEICVRSARFGAVTFAPGCHGRASSLAARPHPVFDLAKRATAHEVNPEKLRELSASTVSSWAATIPARLARPALIRTPRSAVCGNDDRIAPEPCSRRPRSCRDRDAMPQLSTLHTEGTGSLAARHDSRA